MRNAGGGAGGRQRNIASMFASQANSQPSQLAQALALSTMDLTANEEAHRGQDDVQGTGVDGDYTGMEEGSVADDRPALIPCATTSAGIHVHRWAGLHYCVGSKRHVM